MPGIVVLGAQGRLERSGVKTTTRIILFFLAEGRARIWSNIFSSLITLINPSSAPRIYKCAFKKCKNHPEVIATFGGPINDYAWYPGGSIMQRVSAKKYKRDTVKCMRLTFLISVSKINEATVHVDLKKNSIHWTYDVRYIIVKFGKDPSRSITIKDNQFDS